MFFRSGVTPPNPTAKPSWGWLRVGVRKPRLVLAGTNAARNEVTTKARAYWRGCPLVLVEGVIQRGVPPRSSGASAGLVQGLVQG